MALSRLAEEFAAEIRAHDWSDAPWRLDRAGHDRATDSKKPAEHLDPDETDRVRTNVMWVTAQVLLHADPNFSIEEFAVACGIPRRITHRTDGRFSGALAGGLRIRAGEIATPGTWDVSSKQRPGARS